MPHITPEMMEKTAIEMAKRRAGKKESPLKRVKDIERPSYRKMVIELLNSTA